MGVRRGGIMKDNGFVEVVAPVAPSVSSPEWIECYVLKDIDPKMCGTLVRDLNSVLPLRGGTNDDSSSENKFPSMNHLKRIRRRPATIDEIHNRTSISTLAEEDESMESAMRSDSGVEENSNACDDGHPAKKARKMKKNAKCQTKRECGDSSEPYSLDILVGSIVAVDHYLTSRSRSLLSETKTPLSLIFERHDYVQQSLPGRPARTRDELNMWNATMWPTLFFEEKTEKFKVEQLTLTPDEVTMMMNIGMSEAVKDAIIGRRQWTDWSRRRLQVEQRELIIDPIIVCGAVVMNPVDGAIISRAADERRLQGISHDETNNEDALMSIFPDEVSPLCTSILLAIQGVSRRERHAALGYGMESEEFQKGQYLCTGYDVYITKEPTAFEAMALVHSRVRRVVFGLGDRGMGGLGGPTNVQSTGIHSLPGTNHHHRAFRVDIDKCDASDETMVSLRESLIKLHGDLI